MYLQAEECVMKSTIENINATLVENVKNEYPIPVQFLGKEHMQLCS